ncbi:MAG TPA: TIGR00725 family protein [Candidatus Aminicenantes bacterium]|nr:TIGR00725 family protein [Candidatus Aminicenantes bacterium]
MAAPRSADAHRIGVIGGSQADREELDAAVEAGRLIASAGYTLVCGGLGGVMEAAARGASEKGGAVIGILPGQSLADANPHVTVPIATGLGLLRNSLVVLNSEVLIATGGRYGTLSEIAYAGALGRPVFGIGTWPVEGVVACATSAEALERASRHLDR